MSQRRTNQHTGQSGETSGTLLDLWHSLRLAWRLLGDARVSPLLKGLIPGLAVLYLLFPIDLLPDFLPLAGQVDDLVLFLLGLKFFIELSPREVVEEHRRAMGMRGGGRVVDDTEHGPVIDGQYRVIDK